MVEKKALSIEAIESQAVLELPDREMMLVTIVITNLLNNNMIEVDVSNNKVALQVCAALINTGVFRCEQQL